MPASCKSPSIERMFVPRLVGSSGETGTRRQAIPGTGQTVTGMRPSPEVCLAVAYPSGVGVKRQPLIRVTDGRLTTERRTGSSLHEARWAGSALSPPLPLPREAIWVAGRPGTSRVGWHLMTGRFLRTRDVAYLLDTSCETVLRWHRSGKLP